VKQLDDPPSLSVLPIHSQMPADLQAKVNFGAFADAAKALQVYLEGLLKKKNAKDMPVKKKG
jgi:hypothetical protein